MMTGSDGDQYVYDGLDQGVAKIGGMNASELIYFGGQMIALRNASTGAYTDMIWAGSNLLGVVAGTQTAAPSWRLVDHLGSLAVMTDNSGNVIATNVLAPYGQVLSSNAADPYPFAQMQYDTILGTPRGDNED